MALPSPDRDGARRRNAWLREAAKPGAGPLRRAALFLCLDGVAAMGFAFALASGLVALPHGVLALLPWLGLALAAMAARGLLARLALGAGAEAARRAKTALRRRITIAALAIPPGERPPTGQLAAAAVEEVEALDGHVARFLPARLAAGLVPFLVAAATAAASPMSAGILVFTLLPFVLALALAGGAAADAARRQFLALSRLSGLFADRLGALPVILAFQAEGRETARLAQAADDLRRRNMSVLRIAFVSSGALEFFSALSVALVAVYCGFNLLGLLPFPAPEKLDLHRAFFVLALAPEFYAPMRRLAAAYHDRQAAEAAADRLMPLEARPRLPTPAAPALTAPPAIRFERVTVRFAGQDRPALEELTLEIAPGETVALLGPSGSGKSTALNLLLGLAPLTSGEVHVGGLVLSEAGSFAPSIAWMGQRPLIIPGTIAENLALARRDATPAEIARAAAEVGLEPLISGRQGGLGARLDERGGGLSGGERHRIGLARALLKPAPILLLDEPTAHLDAAGEHALIAAIRRAAQGRTTLIATHSEAVAAAADRVMHLGVPA
ncbi:thiol reductant ABC exporter subunit CydD [Roseococcus sp. YIM B11640]|uniref:thiol reductant ABC exporter subunit CydD n=1 Tax=Roseococcus sp. YIM B11640 TaxID=3133973 RepID=UPI003C7A6C7F